MINCELCQSPAAIYCHSDDAHLCWTCDRQVHAVNFLVARHIRTLLCRSCQSPTPWMAAGANLGRTVSVCGRCVIERSSKKTRLELRESEADNEESLEVDADLAADEVVPPPPAASSSSSSCISDRECSGRSTLSEFSVEGIKYQPNDNTVSSCGRKSRRRRREYKSGGDVLKEHRTHVKLGSRSVSNINHEKSDAVDLSLTRKTRPRIGGSY